MPRLWERRRALIPGPDRTVRALDAALQLGFHLRVEEDSNVPRF